MNTLGIKTGALILSAGESSRMGKPKALLSFDNRRTFVEKIIEDYQKFGCTEIAVVLNSDIFDEVTLDKSVIKVLNKYIDYGRFYSVRCGLQNLIESDYCFIQNIDNPFQNRDILEKLYSVKEEADYCVPVYQGRGGHPIIINKKIINGIISTLADDLILSEYLNRFTCSRIETAYDSVLININTPEDYQKYFKNHV